MLKLKQWGTEHVMLLFRPGHLCDDKAIQRRPGMPWYACFLKEDSKIYLYHAQDPNIHDLACVPGAVAYQT